MIGAALRTRTVPPRSPVLTSAVSAITVQVQRGIPRMSHTPRQVNLICLQIAVIGGLRASASVAGRALVISMVTSASARSVIGVR